MHGDIPNSGTAANTSPEIAESSVDGPGTHPKIWPSLPTTLKAIGCDELWLQDWIVATRRVWAWVK